MSEPTSDKIDIAFTAVIASEGIVVGIAQRNIPGYSVYKYSPTFESFESAQKFADEKNTAIGLSIKDAYEIVLSSLRLPSDEKDVRVLR